MGYVLSTINTMVIFDTTSGEYRVAEIIGYGYKMPLIADMTQYNNSDYDYRVGVTIYEPGDFDEDGILTTSACQKYGIPESHKTKYLKDKQFKLYSDNKVHLVFNTTTNDVELSINQAKLGIEIKPAQVKGAYITLDPNTLPGDTTAYGQWEVELYMYIEEGSKWPLPNNSKKVIYKGDETCKYWKALVHFKFYKSGTPLKVSELGELRTATVELTATNMIFESNETNRYFGGGGHILEDILFNTAETADAEVRVVLAAPPFNCDGKVTLRVLDTLSFPVTSTPAEFTFYGDGNDDTQ